MTNLCRNGHDLTEPTSRYASGRCRECYRANKARYDASPNGRAANYRYQSARRAALVAADLCVNGDGRPLAGDRYCAPCMKANAERNERYRGTAAGMLTAIRQNASARGG